MTPTNRTLTIGHTLLIAIILALGIAVSIQPAGATCSDTAERYPMLIGSGYEGEPCELADTSCQGTAARFPMLVGSGYEGEACTLATTNPMLDPAARSTSGVVLGVAALVTTNPTWQATMLDGSGYEREAIDTALSGDGRD
jgi:hypothetical protein